MVQRGQIQDEGTRPAEVDEPLDAAVAKSKIRLRFIFGLKVKSKASKVF